MTKILVVILSLDQLVRILCSRRGAQQLSTDSVSQLRKLIMADLQSPDSEARSEFFRHFGAEAEEFAMHTAIALDKWTSLHDAVPEDDLRRLSTVAILFTAINLHSSSFKLFMSGHTVAAGGLFRQVLEAVSMALLCSAKGLNVLDRFLEDKYSTNDAVMRLVRNHKNANVKPEAVEVLKYAYNFYHKYAHLTKLTIATGANFELGGVPNIGAFFDPAKAPEYKKEVDGRVSLAKIFPNLVDAVTHNIAAW
jgi:hypothetical protein